MRHLAGVLFILIISITLAAQTNSEQAEFRDAAGKPQAAGRVAALAQFLADHPQASLKLDALELLVWNSRTGASLADLEHWTSELLKVSPQNPLAAAVILGDSLPIGAPEPPADRAKASINALDHFDRPEGLSHQEFAEMRNYVIATLNGVVGYSYFEQKDFAAARPYLRNSVVLIPNDAQLTYTLALSDLAGSQQDQAEGFLYLARSVNLTRGTPAGETLATFARNKYVAAGGTNADWDKYLQAAPVFSRPAASEPVEAASAPAHGGSLASSSSSMVASATPPAAVTRAPSSSSVPTASSKSASGTPSPGAVATAEAPARTPAQNSVSSPTVATGATSPPASSANQASPARKTEEVAMAAPPLPPEPSKPTYNVMPPRHIPQLVRGAPMSIGILIQSELAQRQSRNPIVYSLIDMVRRLHPYDEAFVMSFSKGMVFQEDLTSNDKELESAMDAIAPEQGSAIYDAVTFAAGHLNRIARNPNRVLIVLAGEGDRSSSVSPLELSSELNVSGVRIYCIGLGVDSTSDENRLRQLAAYTGGHAYFLPGPTEVRSAIRSIAGDLGITYPN